MTLTEQWKHGKLKEGWYYYKASDGRNDIATEYGLYCVEADNNVELEVLAPVPSYEEWQHQQMSLRMTIDDYKNVVDICEQLKELLKECRERLGDYAEFCIKGDYLNAEDEAVKMITKIDNVLGEKK